MITDKYMDGKYAKNFTGLYEISKTLRFQLKPLFETKKYLEENGIIQADREIQENYHLMKEILDDFHIKFVEQSLNNAELSLLEEFYSIYRDFQLDPKNMTKKLEEITKDIHKEVVSFFEGEGNKWKKQYSFLKKGGIGFLTEKEILQVLILLYPEKEAIIKKFDRFFTYFSHFNESRKNFYADDGRAGALSTRIIDDNLIFFIENMLKFEKFYENNQEWCTNNLSSNEREIFQLNFYNSCLLQKGIDHYNKIIGGYSEENGNKILGINEKINLLKQEANNTNKKDLKFPKFDLLYKQILSKVDKQSFHVEIKNDEELINIISFVNQGSLQKVQLFENLFVDFFDHIEKYDIDNIYISKGAVNTISAKFFENWESLKHYLGNSKKDFYSFGEIKTALLELEETDIFKENYYLLSGISRQNQPYPNFLKIFRYELLSTIQEFYKNSGSISGKDFSHFEKNENDIQEIKLFFDSIQSLYKMLKYFHVVKNKKTLDNYEKDIHFYNDFDTLFTDFDVWKQYNLVRNYLTKKQVKIDKFKLNFDRSQFLTGWDKDKESERLGVILKDEKNFYLAILKDTKTIENSTYKGGEFYEKMNYKQLNNIYRQLPRLLFPLQKKLEGLDGKDLEKYLGKYFEYGYSPEIAEIKKEFDIFQKNKNKGEVFNQEKLSKLIEYYQNGLYKMYGQMYDLEKICSKKYTDLVTFYQEVEEKMYKLDFSKISKEYIEQKVKNGDLYLFQIYNKDFSEGKKSGSKENIHTTYFKLLFDEKNLEHLVYKLSGGAEIFFRDKTDNLKTKKDKSGKEVVAHKRYANDKIMLHISVTLNANKGDKYQFNQFVNQYLQNNNEVNIIGIDRGEKHLAYYTVIDKKGNTLERGSLNEVNNIDYQDKLSKVAELRKEGRESWGDIENIKELKNGYISHVVHKLCELVLKYNAIIVLEELNTGFKRGRQKIEKQIYQKLELALAKKLNYLTIKEREKNELGGYLYAYQLVPKVTDYQDIAKYKQAGIMFYTRANYTSTTCPCCGFRKNKYISNSSALQSLKTEFQDIQISYDGEKFVFEYDVIDNKKLKLSSKSTHYKINSNYARYIYNSKQKSVEEIHVTQKLIELFSDMDLYGNINSQIENRDLKFYKSLVYYFNLVLQLRNSDSKRDIDYIICPSCNFHSKDGFQGGLWDADANGAYNIARKGIITLQNIDTNPEKPNLLISDVDWDNFAQT